MIHGRGASGNPGNRFTTIEYEPDGMEPDAPKTIFYRDTSKTIIAHNDSPDVGFESSINPYRGCEHGCIYCYARPTHEYFGLSAGLDFETKIFVKENAPDLLSSELSSKKWKPQVVAISGVTDCYQPAERKFQLTRKCLEVFAEFRNPVIIITKNHLVTRDIDVLSRLAEINAVSVNVSITTLDSDLCRKMEPRTSTPRDKLRAIEELSAAGIPAGVLVAPVIPGLTDSELPSILLAAREAGAQWAGYVMLRLPHGVGPLFETWLGENVPLRKEKVLHRVASLRAGKMNDPRFGSRMKGEGVFAEQVQQLFALAKRKAGFPGERHELSTAHFQSRGEQLSLF